MARNQNPPQIRPQNRGFIVTELITMGIILMSVAGIAAATKFGFSAFDNYKAQAAMMEQESLLIGALQSDMVLAGLKTNLQNAATQEIVTGTPIVYNAQVLARQKQKIYLDESNKEVLADEDPLKRKIEVEFEIRCQNIVPTGSECWAAYRMIDLKSQMLFGSPVSSGGNSFQENDFNLPIPFEIATRDTQDQCDLATNAFATGYNKSTGAMSCALRPLSYECGNNEIARGLYYDMALGMLRLRCEPLRQTVCPANYVLQSVETASLHPGYTDPVQGSCVFAAQRSVPMRGIPAPAGNIYGTFCPNFYRANSSCQAVDVSTDEGSCWNPCQAYTNDGQAYTDYCRTPQAAVVPANNGVVHTNPTPRSVSCYINYPEQQCGARFFARASISGTCDLTLPENTDLVQ